eukprot:2961309-Pyramimonas_sp.AAC.1
MHTRASRVYSARSLQEQIAASVFACLQSRGIPLNDGSEVDGMSFLRPFLVPLDPYLGALECQNL